MTTTRTHDDDPYTDEALTAALVFTALPGKVRRAEYLLQVPYEVRADIAAEASTMLNLAPGWRPSDTIEHQVQAYLRTGAVPTRYRDDAARIRKTEGTGPVWR